MRCLIAMFCVLAIFSLANAQTFPTRPVRVVVPVPPGGSLDVMARILAPKWGEVMGQNVIIDYRPGANTIVGSELVARAAPDGYTLLINTLPFVVNPALYRKMPFDTERDFASATSSLTVFGGRLLLTTSTCGASPSMPIGWKSRSASKGTPLMRSGLVAIGVLRRSRV